MFDDLILVGIAIAAVASLGNTAYGDWRRGQLSFGGDVKPITKAERPAVFYGVIGLVATLALLFVVMAIEPAQRLLAGLR